MSDDLREISDHANRRVGQELVDQRGYFFYITDVLPDGRIRVVSDDGRDHWWNATTKFATLISKKADARKKADV